MLAPRTFAPDKFASFIFAYARSSGFKADWNLSFTSKFLKDAVKVSQKLQAKILMAVQDLAKNPKRVRGNTLTPLRNNKKGLWRYRVGDFRIIYAVSSSERVINLMRFKNRSEV